MESFFLYYCTGCAHRPKLHIVLSPILPTGQVVLPTSMTVAGGTGRAVMGLATSKWT